MKKKSETTHKEHHCSTQCRRCGHMPGRSLETKKSCPLCGKEMSRQGLHFHLKHVKCGPQAGLRKKKQYSKKRCLIRDWNKYI